MKNSVFALLYITGAAFLFVCSPANADDKAYQEAASKCQAAKGESHIKCVKEQLKKVAK